MAANFWSGDYILHLDGGDGHMILPICKNSSNRTLKLVNLKIFKTFTS